MLNISFSQFDNSILSNIIESVMFPFLNTKLEFSAEADAHKVIHVGLTQLSSVISAAKAVHSIQMRSKQS